MSATRASILELSKALRNHEISSVTLTEALISRMRTVNPQLNGVSVDRFAAAREDAVRADAELQAGQDRGPLHGIPCTVKEFLAVEGLPHTGGLTIRKGRLARQDATLVQRLRDAGAVILATTNAPEGGLWHETNNRIYGRTSNPHDLSRTSGGSSGGEGALIASGASVFGIGSDVGGSIRIPAAFCGVYGHKPTQGMLPNTGHFPEAPPKPYMTCGPLARSAHDLFPILQALAGPDGVDPLAEIVRLVDPSTVELTGITVYTLPTNGEASVTPEVRSTVLQAGELLRAQGVTVEPLSLPNLKRAFRIWAVLMGEMGVAYDQLVTEGGKVNLARELSRWARGKGSHTGAVLAMVGIQRVIEWLPSQVHPMSRHAEELVDELTSLLGTRAVILHPPFARVAPRHRTIGFGNPADVGLTAVFNILGNPVTVAPIGTHLGVPTAVQIIGAPGSDHLTIRVAMALEAATGGWSPVEPRHGAPWRLGERFRRGQH